MLPDLPGTEICRRIKADPRTRHVPVVMLTAKGDEVDRVVGFELGADDYVTKPFSVRELVLRLRAVLRRAGSGRGADLPRAQVGPIRVDVEAHRAFVDGEEMDLTPLEFRLLTTFMSRLGRVQSREQLLEDVWEMSPEVETRTVDTHVKRLREKLGAGRDLLETVRGIGYRMVDPSDRGQG
jgi:two-component system, OmpR family, phosphate regulon response regulator PhoB